MKVGMDHSKGSVAENQDFIKRDLKTRKKEDYPYKIVTDETYGRHLVASRNIKSGEIILEDTPVTMGPACSSGISPVCLACYKRIKKPVYTCTKCGWPMCSAACEKNPVHAAQECKLFQRLKIKLDSSELNYEDVESLYAVISPIRALLLKQSNPERWMMIWGLMSHNQSRRGEDYWTEKHRLIISNIRERLGITEWSEDDIDTVLGIFLVNDFEITNNTGEEEFGNQQKASIRGLFSIASIPNHSCLCNTSHTFNKENNYRMVVRATRNIARDEDITHTYVDQLEPLLIRQELLNLGKFFHCQCPRCSDPTELGTYSSAMICPKCKKGYMVCNDVSSIKADWRCNKCKEKMSALKISRVSNAVKEIAGKLDYDASDPEKGNIAAHEAFLKKYGQVLHGNHVTMVQTKYTLAKMYGRMAGYTADQLSDEQFQRKQKLCEEVLQVFNKIIPGNARMRGVMLYELHLPLVMLANRQVQRGPGKGVDPKFIKASLKRGLAVLKEGLEILKLEPEGSFDRKIYDGSIETGAVKELEEWYNTISKAM